MIYVDVKTIWHGQVAVHAKYLNYSLKKKENLAILSQGQQMIIPWDQLRERISGKSENKFKDKHGGIDYYLYYFRWVPDKQEEDKPTDPVTLNLF